MKIEFKSFIIGVMSVCLYIIFSGQTHYNVYSIDEVLKKLNNFDVISSEINEIKAHMKHGVKVNGGEVDKVILPVKVNGGKIDRINNSVDCICYDRK